MIDKSINILLAIDQTRNVVAYSQHYFCDLHMAAPSPVCTLRLHMKHVPTT